MVCLSHGLMVTAEQRPAERVSMSNHLLPDQEPHQAQDFWQCVGDQQASNPLRSLNWSRLLWQWPCSNAFFSDPVLARSCIKVAQNWATSERVMCRYHPVQDRTSYWSRPHSPFARSMASSTFHRCPATCTNVSNVVSVGAQT